MKHIIAFINWLGAMFSDKGTVSSKRVAFIAVVVSAIIWLSTDLAHHSMTDNWIRAFDVLVVSVVGGYLGGKGIDAITKKQESDDDTTVN